MSERLCWSKCVWQHTFSSTVFTADCESVSVWLLSPGTCLKTDQRSAGITLQDRRSIFSAGNVATLNTCASLFLFPPVSPTNPNKIDRQWFVCVCVIILLRMDVVSSFAAVCSCQTPQGGAPLFTFTSLRIHRLGNTMQTQRRWRIRNTVQSMIWFFLSFGKTFTVFLVGIICTLFKPCVLCDVSHCILWTLSSSYHVDLLSAHVKSSLWRDVAVVDVLCLHLACVSCKHLNKTGAGLFFVDFTFLEKAGSSFSRLGSSVTIGPVLWVEVNMDHRGHPQPDSARHSHRAKDDYYRHSQQDWDHSYLPPDPRERDRHWAHPGAQYGAHFTSPPARPEQYPYSSHQYPYGYGRPEYQRPQSRWGQ